MNGLDPSETLVANAPIADMMAKPWWTLGPPFGS